MPAWKRDADFLLVHMSFDVHALVSWRSTLDFHRPVFGGILVLSSAKMARAIASTVPEVQVPEPLIAALETDRNSGVDFAFDMIVQVAERLRAAR